MNFFPIAIFSIDAFTESHYEEAQKLQRLFGVLEWSDKVFEELENLLEKVKGVSITLSNDPEDYVGSLCAKFGLYAVFFVRGRS